MSTQHGAYLPPLDSTGGVAQRQPSRLEWPAPVVELIRVRTRLVCMVLTLDPRFPQLLPRRRTRIAQLALAQIDGQDGETEAVRLVADAQLEWRVDVALFLVTAHVHEILPRPVVRQPVHHPGVAVEVEHDVLVAGEQSAVLRVRQPVRVIAARNQLEQVHHVDKADLELRKQLPQQRRGGQ